ncbi:hypothetical protein D3C78_1224280 [compost metagenome]
MPLIGTRPSSAVMERLPTKVEFSGRVNTGSAFSSAPFSLVRPFTCCSYAAFWRVMALSDRNDVGNCGPSLALFGLRGSGSFMSFGPTHIKPS